MSKLVEELKQEHKVLAEALSSIRALSVATPEGQKVLYSTKDALLAHLKKEDNQLYPVLNKAAESDPVLKKTLDVFAKNMEEVSRVALSFFEKYEKGGDSFQFAKDVGTLFAVLSQRIMKEETILYREFDQIVR